MYKHPKIKYYSGGEYEAPIDITQDTLNLVALADSAESTIVKLPRRGLEVVCANESNFNMVIKNPNDQIIKELPSGNSIIMLNDNDEWKEIEASGVTGPNHIKVGAGAITYLLHNSDYPLYITNITTPITNGSLGTVNDNIGMYGFSYDVGEEIKVVNVKVSATFSFQQINIGIIGRLSVYHNETVVMSDVIKRHSDDFLLYHMCNVDLSITGSGNILFMYKLNREDVETADITNTYAKIIVIN